MKTAIALAAIALLTGCVAVPQTAIKGTVAGKPFSLSSPKDSELLGLKVVADTNGTVTITIQSLKCRMNPDVITMTGEAQVKIIQAVANGVSSAMGTAGGAAAASTIGK